MSKLSEHVFYLPATFWQIILGVSECEARLIKIHLVKP